MRAQVTHVGLLFEMEPVRETRRERAPLAHGTREPAESRGRAGHGKCLGHAGPARERFALQEFVERRTANLGADLAVRMQVAAARALPVQVLGRELVGGAGLLHEVRFRDAEQRVHAALRRHGPASHGYVGAWAVDDQHRERALAIGAQQRGRS